MSLAPGPFGRPPSPPPSPPPAFTHTAPPPAETDARVDLRLWLALGGRFADEVTAAVAAAEAAKTKGNAQFAEGRYDDAIFAYTEALTLLPEDSVFDEQRVKNSSLSLALSFLVLLLIPFACAGGVLRQPRCMLRPRGALPALPIAKLCFNVLGVCVCASVLLGVCGCACLPCRIVDYV